MLISNEVEVTAKPDEVYHLLLNLDAVAPCIPGATLGGPTEDGAREAEIEVAFGPMRFRYAGTVRIAGTTPEAHEAVLEAMARETSGEGTASARIGMRVSAAPAGAAIEIETDLRVTGGVAQIGRGMIAELGQELLEEFGMSLSRELVTRSAKGAEGDSSAARRPAAPPPPAAPLRARRLLWRALRRWVRNLFKRRSAGNT
jgi:carbon monoxide dehydrogenase subunit G